MPIFNVSEMLNVAIKDEETGIAFYEALAEVTTNPEIKQHLQHISKQEEHHKQRFTAMLKDVGDYTPQERHEGEYEEYLKAILESRAFPEPQDAAAEARSAKSDREALAMATRLEKDTVIFYNEVKRFLPDSYAEYVDEVIKEEKGHLIELTEIRNKLNK